MSSPSWADGVVAHRGAWRHGPGGRNSMRAFRAALEAGYGALECDLCWSADGVVVVAHGPLASSEDGDLPLDIRRSSWAELAAVALPAGDRLASVAELLALVVSQSRTGAILELKPPSDGSGLELAARVVDEVAAAGAEPWVRYISFDPAMLRRVLELAPGSHCAPLEPLPGYAPADYLADGMAGVDFEHTAYDAAQVAAYRSAGLDVNAWTVDEPEAMRRLITWGASRVTTDEPARLRALWARVC